MGGRIEGSSEVAWPTESPPLNFGSPMVTRSASKNFGGSLVNGITDTQNAALAARGADLMSYINDDGGSFVCLGQSSLASAYTWLPKALTQVGACDCHQHCSKCIVPLINELSLSKCTVILPPRSALTL